MAKIAVAPLVGAWIEILIINKLEQNEKSLPSWERGLKFERDADTFKGKFVAPLVGAWIEIVQK